MKEIGRVHGKMHTYTIEEDSGFFSTRYRVVRDDGRVLSSTDSRASAFRKAHELAGKGSYESP
jgi:hypothetical protein